MKKPFVIAFNGSPRQSGNTVTLFENAMEGARSQGAEVKRIDLYRLNDKGCSSCFYCKRKDKPRGTSQTTLNMNPLFLIWRTKEGRKPNSFRWTAGLLMI